MNGTMTEPRWDLLYAFLKARAKDRVNVPAPEKLEELVTIHGWEVVGHLMDGIDGELKMLVLCDAGVPFDEAMKIQDMREVRYETPE
jgi:hypothetical protein